MEIFPKVSVVMITYAHENYIKQAVEGVLMQEYKGEIELIIANDKSPDQTDLIVKDIIANHPNGSWINYTNHSLNKGMIPNFIWGLKQAIGKYIAICEGDDYWTNPSKIKKQVDLLEANEDCSIIFHPCFNENNGRLEESVSYFKSNSVLKVFSKDILSAKGQFAPTASYFFRKDVLNKLPNWFLDAPVGDFFLEAYSVKDSYGLYMPDVMSVYRLNTQYSWSQNVSSTIEKKIKFNLDLVKFLKLMKVDHGKEFNIIFDHLIFTKYLNCCLFYWELGDYTNFKLYSTHCKKYVNNKDLLYLKIVFSAMHKYVFRALQKIKK